MTMELDGTAIHGTAEPGYEEVAEAFADAFAGRPTMGAGLAVRVDGRPVVRLWGGLKDERHGQQWTEDTASVVFSCTKGVMSVLVARLVQDGLLDYDAPVSRYWPEFAAAGKEDVTVAQLVSHRAGLSALRRRLTLDEALDWSLVTGELAAQEPLWEPGTGYAYHALTFGWLAGEFFAKPASVAIADLNTYNLLFLSLGLLLHWRPRSFLDAVAKAVPGTSGVLIQFPLYGGIAAILTGVAGSDGATLAHHLSQLFVEVSSRQSFPLAMGAYSAVLGFFVPSGGGKWLVEAPYVMQAANALHVHLGWAVQTYNAAEALPNLVNPFWMLPLLGILGLKARDLVGYTFMQLLVHVPLVLGLLWLLGKTLAYMPPVMP